MAVCTWASVAARPPQPQRGTAGRFNAVSTWPQAELPCPALTSSQPSMAQSKASAGLAASGSTCFASAHTSTSWSETGPAHNIWLFRDVRNSIKDETSSSRGSFEYVDVLLLASCGAALLPPNRVLETGYLSLRRGPASVIRRPSGWVYVDSLSQMDHEGAGITVGLTLGPPADAVGAE